MKAQSWVWASRSIELKPLKLEAQTQVWASLGGVLSCPRWGSRVYWIDKSGTLTKVNKTIVAPKSLSLHWYNLQDSRHTWSPRWNTWHQWRHPWRLMFQPRTSSSPCRAWDPETARTCLFLPQDTKIIAVTYLWASTIGAGVSKVHNLVFELIHQRPETKK